MIPYLNVPSNFKLYFCETFSLFFFGKLKVSKRENLSLFFCSVKRLKVLESLAEFSTATDTNHFHKIISSFFF